MTILYPENTFIRYLDYPILPDSILNSIFFCISEDNLFYSRQGIFKYRPSKEIINWVNDNILPKFNKETKIGDLSIQKITPDYTKNPPHTDGSGQAVIFYFISLGGNNVITKWYKEKNETLIREQRIKPDNISYYKPLQEVFLHKFPVKTWVSMSANILHDVCNVETDRISLGIRLIQQNGIKNTEF